MSAMQKKFLPWRRVKNGNVKHKIVTVYQIKDQTDKLHYHISEIGRQLHYHHLAVGQMDNSIQISWGLVVSMLE